MIVATALSGPEGFLVLLIFAVIAFLVFRGASTIDKSRFEEYAKKRGWRVLEVSWDPFGKGWFGEKNDRIYFVRYLTPEGAECVAWMKTSSFSGVYVSDTALISPGSDPKFRKEFAKAVSCPECGVTTPAGVAYCPHCRRPVRLIS